MEEMYLLKIVKVAMATNCVYVVQIIGVVWQRKLMLLIVVMFN